MNALAAHVVLRLEVEDFHTEYCAILDEARYEEWPDLFTEDCLYQIIPRENHDLQRPLALMRCESRGMLLDRVASLRETLFYLPRTLRHMVSGIRVRPQDDGSILAHANYLVLQTDSDQHATLFNYGRYVDRFVREQSGLRLRERLCIFDSINVPSSLVVPV